MEGVGPETTPRQTPARRGTELADALTALIGAVTAAAAIVVIPGSLAMLFRLEAEGFPADFGVVVSLPREFLFALGFAYVLIPLVVLVLLALAIAFVPGGRSAPNPLSAGRRPTNRWQAILLVGFGLLTIVGLPFAVAAPSPPAWVFLAAAATILVWAVALVPIARWYVAEPAGTRPSRLEVGGAAATVTVLAFIGWAIAFATERARLQPATVCGTEGNILDGFLIGETANRVYLAEAPFRVVLLIPDGSLEVNVKARLRIAALDVHQPRAGAEFGLGRVDAILADRAELGHYSGEQLEQIFVHSDVPVFSYGIGTFPYAGDPQIVDVDREEVAARDPIARKIAATVDARAEAGITQPELRIQSVSNSQVAEVVIGGFGACPFGSG